jgi:NHL repeat
MQSILRSTSLLVLLLGATAGASEASFASKPVALKQGATVRITFSVTVPVDAQVSILSPDGKIVRRLAAGLLGPDSPVPFQKGLVQELKWDGKDDSRNKVSGARVRVSLGMQARLDRIIGWSGQKHAAPCGMAAGPDGTLYLAHTARLYAHRENWLITAFNRDGKYLRQVFPGPAGLPPEKRKGWPRIKLDDGAEIPVIWHLLPRSTYPGAVFSGRNSMVCTEDGRLVILSGAGHTPIKYPDLRGGRRLLILGQDGSVPENWLGPEIRPQIGGAGHIALSPDEKYVYATGFVSTGRKGRGPENVVYRLALDGSTSLSAGGSKKAEILFGESFKKLKGPGALSDPQGIATDKDGNIYVGDYDNNRVAIFTPQGKYLDQIKVLRPDAVHVSRKTGAVYVVQLRLRTKSFSHGHYYVPAHNWQIEKLIKFGGLKDKTHKASWTNSRSKTYGGGSFVALDDSGESPVLWVSGTRWQGGPVLKILDTGNALKLLGEPVKELARQEKTYGLGYIGDVCAVGDKVIAQWKKPQIYSASTGKHLGTYSPKRPDGTRQSLSVYGEMTAGDDGNIYYHTFARNGHLIRRFDIAGKPLPFSALKTEKSGLANAIPGMWHGHFRGAGMFIDRRGSIYIPVAEGDRKLEDMKVKVIGADGRIRNQCALRVQVARMGGIAVDSRGNIYVGAQAAPAKARMPRWTAGRLPKNSAAGHPRTGYLNCATVFKFPATGGGILNDPAGNLAALANYKPAPVRTEKAIWQRRMGYVGSHGKELGCHCETSRFDIDGYDRLFVPDLFRFRVYVLDSAGNQITHFGSYGNMDSRGPGSPVPQPEITFGWPLSTECSGGKVYTADVVNKRVVAVKFTYAVSQECAIR